MVGPDVLEVSRETEKGVGMMVDVLTSGKRKSKMASDPPESQSIS